MLFDASGRQFQESFINPAGSEAYRKGFRLFVQDNSEAVLSFRRLIESRDKWLFWARVQSWTFLASIIFEGLLAAGLFVFIQIVPVPISRRIAIATLLPTFVCFVAFATAAVRLSILHDSFVELRNTYGNT